MSAPALSYSFGTDLEGESNQEDGVPNRRQMFQNYKRRTSSTRHVEEKASTGTIELANTSALPHTTTRSVPKQKGTVEPGIALPVGDIADKRNKRKRPHLSQRKACSRKHVIRTAHKFAWNQRLREKQQHTLQFIQLHSSSSVTKPILASVSDVMSPDTVRCSHEDPVASLIRLSDQLNSIIASFQNPQEQVTACVPETNDSPTSRSKPVSLDHEEIILSTPTPRTRSLDGRPPRSGIKRSTSTDTISEGSRSEHRKTPTRLIKDNVLSRAGGILLRTPSSGYDCLNGGSDEEDTVSDTNATI